jgi:hypothetical protein
VDGARIVFRDPLLRTAVYQGAPFGRRQAAHRALASSLTSGSDADRRAWHRSEATVGPDDAVAGELEHSAARARLRGGHAAAAAALERAADLSSEPSQAGRRLTAAAADAWMAGRGPRARVLLDRAAPLLSAPDVRADAQYVQGLVESASGDRRVAYDILLAGAEPLAAFDPARAARMLAEAGRVAWSDADLAGMIEVGRRMESLDLSEGMPEAFAVNVMIGLGRLLQRDPAAAPLIQELVSSADLNDPQQLQIAGAASMFAGNDRAAHALLTRAIAQARTLGAITKMPQALAPLASLQMWEGSFPSATAHAWEGVRLAHETGQEHLAAHFHAVLAWIAAVQGRDDECQVRAAHAFEIGRAHIVRPPVAIATWALGLSDLGMGRWPEAMARLKAVVTPHSPESHPMVAILATSDLVETAYRLGRLDLAQAPLARFESFAGPTAAAWTLALVARCRALMCEAETAIGFFDQALAWHAQAGRRFDQARTRLLYAESLRRACRRADARSPCGTPSIPSSNSVRPRGRTEPQRSCAPPGKQPGNDSQAPPQRSHHSRPKSCASSRKEPPTRRWPPNCS